MATPDTPITKMVRNKIVRNSRGARIHIRMFKTGIIYKITQGNKTYHETTDSIEALKAFEDACTLIPSNVRKISGKIKKPNKKLKFISGGLPS